MGTLVWDTIRPLPGRGRPYRGWGGIAYSLEAFSALTAPDVEVVPIVKIGEDLFDDAVRYLSTIPKMSTATAGPYPRLRPVPKSNNRVTLDYRSDADRVERLTGGVPGWTAGELGPVLEGLDALYVNFISGFEMTLEVAREVCAPFPGPSYVDLHSLLLGVEEDGTRIPRRLDDWSEWFACFDHVQVNREEFSRLGRGGRVLHEFRTGAVGGRALTLLVTLGSSGAAYYRRPIEGSPPRRGRCPVRPGVQRGDPTGCGDVWGATFFARMLAGEDVPKAARTASRCAALNVRSRGTERLRHRISKWIDRGDGTS